jgi:hypothetical protein
MDRFICVIISVAGAGAKRHRQHEKGRAMPILLWIATIACMLEIALGHPPDRPAHKDLSGRSE